MNISDNSIGWGAQFFHKIKDRTLLILGRKKIIRRPFQYATSRTFYKKLQFLEKSQWWNQEKIREYQARARRSVVLRAFRNIPFYKKLYSQAGFKENDIQQEEAFWHLPYISKEDVMHHIDEMIDPEINRNTRYYATTGGTTGQPVGFWFQEETDAWEEAFVWRHWRWSDVDFSDRCAICRGARPPEQTGSGYASTAEGLNNLLVLSGFDLNWETSKTYISEIADFNPVYIRGYPSSLYLLARRILADGQTGCIPALKVLFTSSELLQSYQRKAIETAFGKPVRDLYGHTERAVAAGECSHGRLHAYPEYGQFEIIQTDILQQDSGVRSGEIVATGFNNAAMPLIRYRTGDLGNFTNEKCSCGRVMPVVQVDHGRVDEFLVIPEGKVVSFTALNFHSDIFDGIEVYQYEQHDASEVIFRYVLLPDVSNVDEVLIKSGLREKLGSSIRIVFENVPNIEKTPRGKNRVILSSIQPLFPES